MKKKLEKKEENGKKRIDKNFSIQKNFRKTHRKIPQKGRGKKIIISFLFALIISTAASIYTRNLIISLICLFVVLMLFWFFFYIKKKLRKTAVVRKKEDVFPDFLQLMASNLRAGMTIDRALLLSSRKEFAPLDKEIMVVGKDIITGKEITSALDDMSKRIGSEKIRKTIFLINSGIRAGGNVAILLEQTAVNMRERNFVEKKAASNVLMYLIFIFFAVSIGAPILFSLSSILVEVLGDLMGTMPSVEITTPNVPFTLSNISISVNFIIYFSLIFITVIDILASLVLGLVSKGKEKEGLKYTIVLIIISVSVFLGTRFLLMKMLATFLM